MDPAQIQYAIVSHAHGDHVGGAKYLQDKFGTRILLSAADWDLLDRTNYGPRPRRDMVVTDGQQLTLGDTTVTMHLTPGHTPGTISTIIPVTDNGVRHVAAVWGGTMFNWRGIGRSHITPTTPTSYWFKLYSDSASRFKDVATAAGVDVLLSNHTEFDGSKRKLPAVAARRPGQPHPYVEGTANVAQYLTLVGECAAAGRVKFGA